MKHWWPDVQHHLKPTNDCCGCAIWNIQRYALSGCFLVNSICDWTCCRLVRDTHTGYSLCLPGPRLSSRTVVENTPINVWLQNRHKVKQWNQLLRHALSSSKQIPLVRHLICGSSSVEAWRPTQHIIVILGTIFTGQMIKPTVSKHWRKSAGRRDQTWIPPEPHHHGTIIQL